MQGERCRTSATAGLDSPETERKLKQLQAEAEREVIAYMNPFLFFLMFLSVMFAVVLADDSLLLSSRRDYFLNGLFTVREV